jgi:hypothetical protein
MSDDRTPDRTVIARLRDLGAEHEPDSDRIWARVDPARAPERERPGAPEAVPLDARRDRHRRTEGFRRPGLVAGLAAVGVLGVVISSQALGGRDGDGPATAVPTVSVSGKAPTTPAGTPSSPAVIGSATATRTAPTAPTTSGTATAPTPGGRDDAAVSLADDDPVELALATPRYLDWVVVGGRADGVTVRAKRPVGGAALTAGPPPSTSVAPSGGTVSWSDGVPEQSRTATTWLAAERGAWRVTVAGAGTRRVLQVHAGLAPELRVEASGAGGWRASGSWTALGTGRYVVRLEIPAAAGPVTVTLTPGGDGRFAVSALTLRDG